MLDGCQLTRGDGLGKLLCDFQGCRRFAQHFQHDNQHLALLGQLLQAPGYLPQQGLWQPAYSLYVATTLHVRQKKKLRWAYHQPRRRAVFLHTVTGVLGQSKVILVIRQNTETLCRMAFGKNLEAELQVVSLHVERLQNPTSQGVTLRSRCQRDPHDPLGSRDVLDRGLHSD